MNAGTLSPSIAAQFQGAAEIAARFVPALQKPKPPGGFSSWTVVECIGDPPELGAVGICDDQARALDQMSGALRSAPAGAVGLLHKVTLNPGVNGYRYGALLASAHLDAGSGMVVASGRRAGGGWS